jgi:hypothetical protein
VWVLVVFFLFVVVGGLLCTTSFGVCFLGWVLFFGLGFVFWFVYLVCSGCAGCGKLTLASGLFVLLVG